MSKACDKCGEPCNSALCPECATDLFGESSDNSVIHSTADTAVNDTKGENK